MKKQVKEPYQIYSSRYHLENSWRTGKSNYSTCFNGVFFFIFILDFK